MVIKSGKKAMELVIIVFVCSVFVTLMFAFVAESLTEALTLGSIYMGIYVLMYIALGRTIIMDENGCEVCLGKYKKMYLWDELQVKRVEDYRYTLSYKYPYYLELYSHLVKFISPGGWIQFCITHLCIHFHFFMYIFQTMIRRVERIYVVDEKCFGKN